MQAEPVEARTVLIVDDDVPFGEFLRAAVESVGHRAIHVANGKDAVAAYEEHRPDLVLLDILLPGKDGFQVCDEIRAMDADRAVPIAFMTGIYKKAQYQRQGLEKHRAIAYLLKPFGVRETWALLEDLLGPAAGDPIDNDWDLPEGSEEDDLADRPVATILADHLVRESTGVLFLRGEDTTFVLYLEEGRIIFLRSNDPADRLDGVLVHGGTLTRDQVDVGLRALQEAPGRKRLGETLISLDLLTRPQLETALQLQLQLILNRVAGLRRGRCLFVPGEHPTEEDVLFEGEPRQILMKAARASGSERAIRESLPPGDAVLARAADWQERLDGLSLQLAEEQALALCDGETSVRRLLEATGLCGFDGPRALLALLLGELAEAAVPDEADRGDADAPASEVDALEGHRFGDSFVEELLTLHARGATGVLSLAPAGTRRDGDTAQRRVAFEGGRVVGAASDAAADRFGEALAALEILDAGEQGEDESDVDLRRRLVEEGRLSLAEVVAATEWQSREIVARMLAQRPWTMTWTPGPAGAPEDLEGGFGSTATEALCWQAIRAAAPAELSGLAPAVGDRIEPRGLGPVDEIALAHELTPAERRALDTLARGPVAVRDLADSSDSAALRDARRTAWGLLASGLAAPARTETDDAADGPATIQDEASGDEAIEPASDDPIAPARAALADALLELQEGAFRDQDGDEEWDVIDFETETTNDETTRDGEQGRSGQRARLAKIQDKIAPRVEVLRSLRRALEGDERRVSIDRASMAELLDSFLDVAETALEEDEVSEFDGDVTMPAKPGGPGTSKR